MNLDVILRTTIPVDMQGRVYSCRNTLQFFTIPIGFFLGGLLVDQVWEPVMASEQGNRWLAFLFGTGKGSGAAVMMFVIGLTGGLVCIVFGQILKKYQFKEDRVLEMKGAAMSEIMEFSSRENFREWLSDNCLSKDGVWLLFGKAGGPETIKASEALEEALCFGWIDGQMKRIDERTYKKYFSLRRENSKWSEKNKALVTELEKQGIMTDHGRKKIEEARENGQWDATKAPAVTEEQVMVLSDILKEYEPAYTNFLSMSLSVKKTYSRAYLDAKTDAGREKRLSWIIERLNMNLKPM